MDRKKAAIIVAIIVVLVIVLSFIVESIYVAVLNAQALSEMYSIQNKK